MMYWLLRGRRWCPFGHKWAVTHITKERFEVCERCGWCGACRTRGLLPTDEEKIRLDMAFERGWRERLLLVDEIKYERAKGLGADRLRINHLRGKLCVARHELVAQLRVERWKGKSADQLRLRELRQELRGLLFGKH